MTVISSTGSDLLSRIGPSRSTFTTPLGGSTPRIPLRAVADPPTRYSSGMSDNRGAVYSDPRAKSGVVHVWSSTVDQNDTVSALMARNRDMKSYALGDQWRGLGGALLKQFGKTGESYTQTLVDGRTFPLGEELDDLAPEVRDQRAADLLAMQATDLANVATNVPTAGLKIQTRSGQSVELKISVNSGFNGIVGMKVELKASGSMSAEERTAVEQLADGLDRALEGLGRDDAVGLDLSGLMGYDRKVISAIDLKADSHSSHQVLGTFSLHLGDDKQSIALKGSDGELALNVNTDAPQGNPSAPQRHAAIQRTLDRMDRAGLRGQANAALVEQMKSAFKAFQATAQDTGDSKDGKNGKPDALAVSADVAVKTGLPERILSTKPISTTSGRAPLDANVSSQLSGLADFDASFGGESFRRNQFGSNRQAGQVHYQLSQKTSSRDVGNGGCSAAQTNTEKLSADFLAASGVDGMLDVRTGNYTTTNIRDSSTVTTLIESATDRITRVLRKMDEDQLKTVTDSKNHHSQSWPSHHRFMVRLH